MVVKNPFTTNVHFSISRDASGTLPGFFQQPSFRDLFSEKMNFLHASGIPSGTLPGNHILNNNPSGIALYKKMVFLTLPGSLPGHFRFFLNNTPSGISVSPKLIFFNPSGIPSGMLPGNHVLNNSPSGLTIYKSSIFLTLPGRLPGRFRDYFF